MPCLYKAIPGPCELVPCLRFEGPGGVFRRSLTFAALAELLRRRGLSPPIGGGPPRPPYGPGDILRFDCRGPGERGRGAWL